MAIKSSAQSNYITTIPNLGSGLSYRRQYRTDIFRAQESVDFLEIVADHFFEPNLETRRELDLLSDHFTLIPHGLGLSLGSAEGLDRDYLRRMAGLVKRIDPPYWSEHIAMTRAGGVEIGHLTPLPFTREAVDAVCRNVAQAVRVMDRPLVLENITYTFAMPHSEMTEAQFLSEILERTDSGMLLDVTNLYANATNHGYGAGAFLSEIPLSRVVQLHYAGGIDDSGHYADTHSSATPEPVWSLMENIMRLAPVRGTILERDEDLPEFVQVAAEVARAREIGRLAGRWP